MTKLLPAWLSSYLGNHQFLSLAGNLTVSALSLLSVSLLFRALPAREIGLWVFFSSIVGLADSFRTGFLTTAFIRGCSGASEARAAEVTGSAWVIALVITGLLGLLNLGAWALSGPRAAPETSLLLSWFGLILVATLPSFMAASVLQAELRFDRLLYLRLLSQGLFVLGIVGLLLTHTASLQRVVYCYALAAVGTSLLLLGRGWARLGSLRHRNSATVRELAHFGKYSVGSYVGSNLLRSSDTFLINFLLGPAPLAVYNLAGRFMEIIEIPLRSFMATAIPAMSAVYNQQRLPEVARLLRKNAGMLTWAFVPVIVVTIALADVPVRLIGGVAYRGTEAANLLRIGMLMALLYPIDRFLGVTLDVVNQPRINLLKVFLMLAVNVVGDVVALLLFRSIYGVALASIPTVVVGFVFGYFQLRRFLPFSLRDILRTGWREIRALLAGLSRQLGGLRPTPLGLPAWLRAHSSERHTYADLSAPEVAELRQRLARFRPAATPDVSVVIPAWNESRTIYQTLSSLAANETALRVELIVINNNSTDALQQVLDELGVLSFLEPKQGIAHARQLGLERARGRYHLCADADTFYPPAWIELMTKPMRESEEVIGVYGRYAFLPPPGRGRSGYWVYEAFTSVLIQLRRKNQEFVNVLGFNMGFVTELGRAAGGFRTEQARVFHNEQNVEESEDGRMAVRLQTQGDLLLVAAPGALVYTSPRKILRDGTLFQAFVSRLRRHAGRVREYV